MGAKAIKLQFLTKMLVTPKEILPILHEFQIFNANTLQLDFKSSAPRPPSPFKQCCVPGKLIVDGKINIVQGGRGFSEM